MSHKMAYSSLRRVDRILKNGLFTGKFNISPPAQPRSLQSRQFLDGPSPSDSDVPVDTPVSFSSTGGGDRKNMSGGSGSDGGMSRRRFWIALGTSGILGCSWAYFKKNYKDSNSKSSFEKFLGRDTVNTDYDRDLLDWIPLGIIAPAIFLILVCPRPGPAETHYVKLFVDYAIVVGTYNVSRRLAAGALRALEGERK